MFKVQFIAKERGEIVANNQQDCWAINRLPDKVDLFRRAFPTAEIQIVIDVEPLEKEMTATDKVQAAMETPDGKGAIRKLKRRLKKL